VLEQTAFHEVAELLVLNQAITLRQSTSIITKPRVPWWTQCQRSHAMMMSTRSGSVSGATIAHASNASTTLVPRLTPKRASARAFKSTKPAIVG
jgi:hypothetical protein